MKAQNYITAYSAVRDNTFSLNGKVLLEKKDTSFSEFSKTLYKDLNISYPKFFKMDNLSKLAFLSSEILLKEVVDSEKENNIALVFANRSSSLDTDARYQSSIMDKEQYFPSPAVFVYTLPNICVGEISIRHGLQSENAFFIFNTFDAKFMTAYSDELINTGKADSVLCGWVEIFEEEYRSFCYLVEKEGTMTHDVQNLDTLFNT